MKNKKEGCEKQVYASLLGKMVSQVYLEPHIDTIEKQIE